MTMLRMRAWRTFLDPRDPDYADPVEDNDDIDPPDDPDTDYPGPSDYEGTARYHYQG